MDILTKLLFTDGVAGKIIAVVAVLIFGLFYKFWNDKARLKSLPALENFENAFQCAQKMDDSGFLDKLFPCKSAINLCAHMKNDSKAEIFGLRLFETLQQFQFRLKPQDFIVENIDKNIILWKKELNGEWISGIKNILDKIKTYKKKD